MAIWQDLVAEQGFPGAYQTVKRFVRKLRCNQPPQARAVILTAPGEEAQVDYGQGPMIRDPQTGRYRRTRLFVMILGWSRKAVRLLTFRSSSPFAHPIPFPQPARATCTRTCQQSYPAQ
jgi:transposase